MSAYIKLTEYLHCRDIGPEKKMYIFWCDGCLTWHMFYVGKEWNPKPSWQFNGNIDKPTFTPSLKMTTEYPDKTHICHLVLTDGHIHYCGDCTHKLVGKTIELSKIPL